MLTLISWTRLMDRKKLYNLQEKEHARCAEVIYTNLNDILIIN